MKKEEILALGALARIELSEAEIERFSTEFDAILGYVERVKGLAEGSQGEPRVGSLSNVFREDTEPHAPGLYTDDLLKAAPDTQGRHIRVKKILGN